MAIAFAVVLPGSIGSYNDLVEKVALWLDRDDLEPRVQDFVALAEARFNRILRTPEMETGRITLEATEKVALPLDYLEMRSLYLEGSPDNPDLPLRAMSPNALAQQFSGYAARPLAYAIAGREIRFAPPPIEPITVSLDYYRRISSLSESEPTNWLLEQHPDIYLYGSLVQAEAFIANDERIILWKNALDEALEELQSSGQRARWGGGPLVANTVRQVRGARC